MTDFIAHVMEEGKPSNWFRHEFEAKDYAEAIEFARSGVVQAYKDEKKTEARNTIITLLLLNFDVPPRSWRLKMPSEEIEECPVPCPTCSGVGGVDSGGVDPQGRGIDIPCPSCSQDVLHLAKLKLEKSLLEDMKAGKLSGPEKLKLMDIIRQDTPTLEEVATQLKASAQVSANLDREERDQAVQALNALQDSVWMGLDKYSKALGWGLTGIQPECWALLDSAVEELVKARKIIKETREALHMPKEHSDDNVPSAARLLMTAYEASQPPKRG